MRNTLIVEDHPVERLGLKCSISSESDFNVCVEVNNFNSMMTIIKNESLQIILLAKSMQGIFKSSLKKIVMKKTI